MKNIFENLMKLEKNFKIFHHEKIKKSIEKSKDRNENLQEKKS